MIRKVPFFNYPDVFTRYEEEFVSTLLDVGRRGAFILQRDLEEFERAAAAYVGAKHALGVGNATDGLIIALRAADLRPGDEVLFSTHTFVATAEAIHTVGGIPVPVDCDADHLMDPSALVAAITDRTRAILPTQLNGRTCRMDEIQAIADEYGLFIVEDAAQAFGARYRGRAAGTFGLASAISFYPAKTLGCLGDGGLVLTNDDEMFRKLKLYRDHGRVASGDVVVWAGNTRLDNLQAAFLNVKLRHYAKEIGRRREIAGKYQQSLQQLSELTLPPGPDSDPDYFDIFQNYEIEAEGRDDLKLYLAERGVQTLVQWGGKGVHQFRELGFTQSLPRTEALLDRMLMLPMNTSLTDADIDYVCENIASFYQLEGRASSGYG